MHSQHETSSDNIKVVQIESADEIGDDFGLSCSSGSCTAISAGGGYVAIDADGTSSTDYVEHARHSRVAWGYLGDPVIDAGTDEPFMMFQLERPASGSCADTGTHDDIGRVDGAWNSSTSTWDWTVETDGGSPDCPVVHIDDAHDNSSVPLLGDEYKMYYKTYGSTPEWYVSYWNGSEWEDDAVIEFYWDGSSTSGPDHDCVENVSALVFKDGAGDIYEGMFFQLLDTLGGCGTGLDDDSLVDDDAAIVFAEHMN